MGTVADEGGLGASGALAGPDLFGAVRARDQGTLACAC
jgi:hypothetical protein